MRFLFRRGLLKGVATGHHQRWFVNRPLYSPFPGWRWGVPLTGLPVIWYWMHQQRTLAPAVEEPLFIQMKDQEVQVEPLKILWRFVVLSLLYTPLLMTIPIWLLYGLIFTQSDNPVRRLWIRLLCQIFELSGPTFIKLGQWASTRADLFPPEFCQILSRLQASVKAHSWEDTRLVLEREYGQKWHDIFEWFDIEPIGIGAIAQAKLKENKQLVAVKVLHPGVQSLIYADLQIMEFAAKGIARIPGAEWLSLPEEVHTFGKMMKSQLDLRNEARNLQLFDSRFQKRTGIRFPKVYKKLERQSILVEEYMHGVPINRFLTLGPSVYDSTVASRGLNGFLQMLIVDNFVHADLHPGNILFTFEDKEAVNVEKEIQALSRIQDPREWQQKLLALYHKDLNPQLVFLDAGLVSSLSQQNLINFLDVFNAITQFDGERIAHLMVERSVTSHTVIDKDVFVHQMTNLMVHIKEQATSLQHLHIGHILATVLNLIREHHVKIEGEFVSVVVAIGLIEGIGQRLDDKVDVIQESVPILKSVRHRGDTIAALADQVYRKAQLYSTAITIKDQVSAWFS